MPEEHLILCGGVSKSAKRGVKVHELQLGKEKDKGEIYLDIETLTEKMVMDLPPVLHDLLQVATYVYVADQVVSRGGLVRFDYGDKWHRYLHFVIPIREYDVWTDPEVGAILEDALSFGSGDTYTFDFVSQEKDRYLQFLNFPSDAAPKYQYDEVLLFSGGIDSFTGAVDELVANKKRSVLVSHRSNYKLVRLQRILFDYLTITVRENADLLERGLQPVHVPVMINKKKEITKETSQRTRSFLYASLGTIVARIFGLNRVKFYENGVVSCNLSFDGQTLQARSTRSTHPKLLYLLSKFVSELTDSDFTFENPYFAKTKTEVCLRLKELHHEPQIEQTRSCAKSNYVDQQKHCGTCSQCIDRRFATLASECQKYDPEWGYALDIFKDELTNTHDRAMAAGFVGFANQIEGMTDVGFVKKCGAELHEIAPYVHTDSREVAIKALYRLHKRHAVSVGRVMDKQIADNSTDLRRATLPKTCLTSMVANRQHLNAGRIRRTSSKSEKHAKGALNGDVDRLLKLHPKWTAPQIAEEIRNTTADAVRHTYAWKNRNKKP